MVSYLVAFLALTAERSAPTVRVLSAGVGAGILAAGLWLAVVLAVPPIPPNGGLAVFVTAAAAAGAAWLNAGAHGSPERALRAALCAGIVAQALVFSAVGLLSSFGPARLIPDLVPSAHDAAADLANSRIEIRPTWVCCSSPA